MSGLVHRDTLLLAEHLLSILLVSLCPGAMAHDDQDVVAPAVGYLTGSGYDINSLTNDYSIHGTKGWLAIAPISPMAKDAGFQIYVSTNGLVEVFYSWYPGWSYSLGRTVASNEVEAIASSVISNLGLDVSLLAPNIESYFRVVFFPKAHAVSKPVLFLYATPDFSLVLRRRQGGAADSYVW